MRHRTTRCDDHVVVEQRGHMCGSAAGRDGVWSLIVAFFLSRSNLLGEQPASGAVEDALEFLTSVRVELGLGLRGRVGLGLVWHQ